MAVLPFQKIDVNYFLTAISNFSVMPDDHDDIGNIACGKSAEEGIGFDTTVSRPTNFIIVICAKTD